MPPKEPSLDTAYALKTPDDSRRLYAQWSETYDQTFARAMDYRMPQVITQIYADAGEGKTPVLDVGAGTGLVGQAMPASEDLVIDALDISPQMLAVAGKRRVYRTLIPADLTAKLPISNDVYKAILSAGTFTHGHVGPDAIDELLRVAAPGAIFILGINREHYVSRGFDSKFAALEPYIQEFERRTVPIYGANTDAAHQNDLAHVAVFRKTGA